MKQITTIELNRTLSNPGVMVIDVRPVQAYNGWKLKGEKRGGHIQGAKSLPQEWTAYIDWIEIVRSKNILPHLTIVLYGYPDNDLNLVSDYFIRAGYGNVSTYQHFLSEWATDDLYPMESLPRYRNLIYPQWLNAVIQGHDVPESPKGDFVICHAHYRNRDAYLSGHIPGAIDIDTLALEAPETWNRRSPEELEQALLQHGITSNSTVVLYGKFMFPDNADEFPGSAAGDIAAIRCAFIMLYAGVKDVRVLNGGFLAWENAGYEIHTDDVQKKPVTEFGAPIPAQPDLAVDIPEAKSLLTSEKGELVCVRSLPEFLGEVSGYNYIEKKGRIPGAVFADCGTDAYHMENYRNNDHTTREYHEIEEIWLKSGITPDKRLAFYCGTGWRGSEAFYNAWLMGWPNIAVFDGGWFEWSNDPNNPVETGKSEKS
jgi:molybdopterin synthase sulfurtransferase